MKNNETNRPADDISLPMILAFFILGIIGTLCTCAALSYAFFHGFDKTDPQGRWENHFGFMLLYGIGSFVWSIIKLMPKSRSD